jgi:hypothetical protein
MHILAEWLILGWWWLGVFFRESQDLSNGTDITSDLANLFFCLHIYSLWCILRAPDWITGENQEAAGVDSWAAAYRLAVVKAIRRARLNKVEAQNHSSHYSSLEIHHGTHNEFCCYRRAGWLKFLTLVEGHECLLLKESNSAYTRSTYVTTSHVFT